MALIKKDTKKYKSAEIYGFSNEIKVNYAIYNDDGVYYAKADYRVEKNYKKGTKKKITKRTEKGLRGKTEEEVVLALEKVPYYDDFAPFIVSEINRRYEDNFDEVTLKTLWFILRENLEKRHGYNDDLAKKLFTDNSLSDLYPEKCNGKELEESIKKICKKNKGKFKILDCIIVIYLILDEATKNALIGENIITDDLIDKYKNTLTKKEAVIRDNMLQKSLETHVELYIVNELIEKCSESSLYLGILMRLLTGLKVSEVCALTWSDFDYDSKTKCYSLNIDKFIDKNTGDIKNYAFKNIEKFRKIPLSPSLGLLVEKRKRFLTSQGIDKNILKEYPIIHRNEKDIIEKIKSEKKIDFCPPWIVRTEYNKILKPVDLDSLVIIFPGKKPKTTNIKRYLGDQLYRNFKTKAKEIAGLETDELSFYLGLKQTDTFSKHYCDYNNPFVQLLIASKLERWHSHYFDFKNSNIKANKKSEVYLGDSNKLPCCEFEIENIDSIEKSVSLNVETDNGFFIAIKNMKRRS